MDEARDIATGELILAGDAKARRAYRCPRCHQRVDIRERRRPDFKRYFAHFNGVADPDCDLYYPPRYRYSGRAATHVYREEADRLKNDHLELTLGPHGPVLVLCLPPTGEKEWTGSIQFSAARVSRRLHWHTLKYGQRIEFALFDGMWSLIPEGIISPDYLESVQLGVQMLESGANLFYVERGLGRRVLPAESVSCGESIRWLSRQSFHIPVNLRDVIHVDCEYQANGWTLNRLAIPQELADEEIRTLTEWLQRRVIERRVRVWMETPWALGHTPQGMPIYPVNVPLTLLADQQVDLQVRDVRTPLPLARADEASKLEFVAREEGTVEILVNDYHYEFFCVGTAITPLNALVRFAGADFVDISNAQRSLDTVIAAGRDRCPLLVKVGHPELYELLSTHATSIERDDCVLKTTLFPGSSLRFDKLGELHWPAPIENHEVISNPIIRRAPTSAMKERARWLRSLSSSTFHPSNVRLRMPDALAEDRTFGSLSTLSWSVQWAPHVRKLQRDLESVYP